MNLEAICLEKIFPALKQMNPGFRMTRIPGYAGVWFDCDNVSFCLKPLPNGDSQATCSIANVLIPNFTEILETPFDFLDWIRDSLQSWLEIPVEGRTTTRSEEFEKIYGTLSGVSPDKILQNGESEDFEGAVMQAPEKLISLI
jgi:hypothetical protein